MNNKNQNSPKNASDDFKQNHTDEYQIAEKQIATPENVKTQEDVLSGLSDKEREQAAEADHKNIIGLAHETGGLSKKERLNAAEADGKIGDREEGLSDKERREAADESW